MEIIRSLVSRTHTDNAMSGKGNSQPMTDLLRKLDALAGMEGGDD